MAMTEPLSSVFPSSDQDGSSRQGAAEPIYLASIDIGTNSTHLLVAKINPCLNTFSVEIAEKSTTRLGERDLESGELTKDAINRVLETLRRFKELAYSYKVREILIAATSAVREASNGKDLIGLIKTELDLNVDLISGLEEARLIYLGVLSGISFDNTPHIVIDIGGGSTELILADGNDARALTSTKIGAVRLQRDFVNEEPLSSQSRDFLSAYIHGSLQQAVEKILSRINSNESPLLVGTSGTIMALGTLISSEEFNRNIKLQGYRFSKEKLDSLIDILIEMTPEQRKKLTNLNERRSEIIIPGALILQTSMRLLGINNLMLSERALREGLIVDWMIRHGYLENRFSYQKTIRKRTVIHQVERFAVNRMRAELVAKNALTLYDSTKGILHKDKGLGRELLWAAAMLHACGKHINRSAYHKHSWYLIRNGELLGYSQVEHLMVAAIARYHRRSQPKKRHEAWQIITNKYHRTVVEEMSLLLRIASSIDKRPDPVIRSLNVKISNSKLIFDLVPIDKKQNLSLEKWSLQNCGPLLKSLRGIELIVV